MANVMTARLCDDDGMASYGVEFPKRYPCTGSAHISDAEFICTNPIHDVSHPRCCDHALLRTFCPCQDHMVSGTHPLGWTHRESEGR